MALLRATLLLSLQSAALALHVDVGWSSQLEEFQQANASSFALGGGDAQLDWTELHDQYQAAMEGPLEEVLQRLDLDAKDFLEQLSASTHESVLASPLPQEAIAPVRAFADYKAFEQMMRQAATAAP